MKHAAKIKMYYFLFWLVLVGNLSLCFGHAHIFIDYKIHACVSDKGLDGVFVNWSFDRMFTQFIQKEFDLDQNGKLDKNEQKKVYETNFKSYKDNNYFAVIEVDGQNYSIPEPKNFSARIDKAKGVVNYSFYLPMQIKPGKKNKNVRIRFFDPVIYVAFTIIKKDISIQNKSQKVDAAITLKQIKYANHPTISFKERS